MARLARYAHVTPDLFGTMTPARSRTLDKHVMALVAGEWELQLQHAHVAAGRRA
jgi:hypothetical protein